MTIVPITLKLSFHIDENDKNRNLQRLVSQTGGSCVKILLSCGLFSSMCLLPRLHLHFQRQKNLVYSFLPLKSSLFLPTAFH
jgi:hypothetical protein